MRLGVAIATWRRPFLTELMLKHTLTVGFDKVVAVRSPEDPNRANDVEGVEYVEHENHPLTEKWAAGIKALQDCDAVMILGSDDFVNEAFVEAVRDMLGEGYDYIQPSGLWFYDADTMRCGYGEAFRIGAGRTLSRKMLDLVGWNPCKESAHIGKVDSAMDATLDDIRMPQKMKRQLEDRRILVDVKTENKWSYDDMGGLMLAVHHPIKFWKTHFPHIAEEILNLQ